MKEGRESVSVRKIENGYLIDHSREGPNGYDCSTRFSAEEPKVKSATVSGATRRDTTGFDASTMGNEINEAINGKAFK